MYMKNEGVQLLYRTNPITPEVLDKAHKLGVIPKGALLRGRYYKGSCRNANIAFWDGEKFHYWRDKFGALFIEKINCPEDDNGFDIFIPVELVEENYD